uniref:hypothetical protein n=1 Tax=Halopseudomonas sp. TaxID=2901191 RepID=UPI00356AC491
MGTRKGIFILNESVSMKQPGYPLLLAGLLGISVSIGALAQQAPEVAAKAERIVADPEMLAQERMERSIKLVESRASIERSRGMPDVAEKLQRVVALLRTAPQNGEAAQLAAEAAVAAERGAIVDALVLAESAAALSPDWSSPP